MAITNERAQAAQAALVKIMEQGFANRFALGIEEGLSRARELRLEQVKSLVLRLLRRKIGELSTGSQERIASLTPGTIEDPAEALLSMQSPVDLDAWLNANT